MGGGGAGCRGGVEGARPGRGQGGVYGGRRLGTMETLDLKKATARVGESWAR